MKMKKGKCLSGLIIIFAAMYFIYTPMIADASFLYHPHAEVKIIGFPTESFSEVDNFFTVILTNEKVWNGEESINEKLGNVVLLELDGGIFTSVEVIHCDRCFDGYGNIGRSELVIDKNFLAERSSAVAIVRYKTTKTSGTISLKATGQIKDNDSFYGADYSDYKTITVSGTIISPKTAFSGETLADLARQRGEFYNQSANLLSNLQADPQRINSHLNEAWTSSMYWILGLSVQIIDIRTAEPPTSARGLFIDGITSHLDISGKVTDYYLEDTLYNIDQAVENLVVSSDYSVETYLLKSSIIKMKNANYKEADYWDSKDLGILRYMFDYNAYSSNIPNEAKILEDIHVNAGDLKDTANTLISTKGRPEDFYALQMAEVIQNFSEKDITYINKMNEAIKNDNFFNDFEGNINNPPKPLLTEEISSFTLEPGQEKDITVKIQNIGGSTNTSGYFDLSVSNGLDVTYWSSSSNTLMYANIGPNSQNPAGLLWKKGCTQDTAQFELISAYDSYAPAELKTINIRIKAVGSGLQWLKYRISMQYADGCEDYTRYPTSGATDQQGWYAIEVPVTISTVKNSPSAPVLSDPGNTISSGSYVITWSQSASATSYVLEESTDSFSSSNLIYTGSSTSKSITKTTNGLYYYRVKACNLDGCSGWSKIEDINLEINIPPYIPGTPSPNDGDTGLPANLILSWNGGDPDAGDTVNYTVYLSSSSAAQICSGTSTSCPVSDLSSGKTYYWKVVADDDKALISSDVWSFTTQGKTNTPPDMPGDPSPIDGATNQPIDMTLSWNGGDPDEGDIVTYTVYLDTNPDPDTLICSDISPSCLVSGLNEGFTYYWKVVADDSKSSQTSPIWSFSTGLLTVHNINKGINYTTIQAAIDHASPGDEIHVDNGTYLENVNVNKQLTLRGIGMPVIDARGSGSAITLAADGIILEGFTATSAEVGIKIISNNNTLSGNNANSNWGRCEDYTYDDRLICVSVGSSGYGIYLSFSNNNTLSGNNANSNRGYCTYYDDSGYCLSGVNGYGIYLFSSNNNTLSGNNASSNDGYNTCSIYVVYDCYEPIGGYGIYLESSSNNNLISNNANSNNEKGIYLTSSNNNNLINNNADSNNEKGIYLTSSSNNTLNDNNASNNMDGILLDSSSNNTLSGNDVSNNWKGIFLRDSGNNKLSANNALNNDYGIFLESSRNNTLSGNKANQNWKGLHLLSSSKCVLTNNIMEGNHNNFGLEGHSYSDFDNQIDTSNLVDGKPIYYIKSATDIVYDSNINVGTFYCISCENVTLKNLDLKNNENGIFLWNTNHSLIQNVNSSNNNGPGIYLDYSNNNTLIGINALNTWLYGISLHYSNNNKLSGNNVSSNNLYGIYLDYSSNNTLSGNNVSKCFYGISLYGNNNMLSGNNANSNDWYGISLYGNNNMLSGNNANSNGVKGISLTGNNNTLISNNVSNNGRSGSWETGSGISLMYSSKNNTLIGNNVKFNDLYGISLEQSSNNTIYNNNLKDNTNQALDDTNANSWDNGYPSGGNFWSDYTGFDLNNGPGQDIPGSDGIGDTPYYIGGEAGAQDRYPMLNRIVTFEIAITSPNGGENWTRGTTQMINWTSTGNPKSYVKIELIKSRVANKLIIASTPNDGSHPWLIPVTQIPGTDYKIKITNTTNASYTDTSDNNFTIPDPSITVVSPNGRESWIRGTTQTIKWNSTGSPGAYVRIELLKGGIFNKTIIASTPNDGSHPWLILSTQAPGTDYKVKITSTANASYTDTSDDNFIIPTPSFTVFSPNGSENWIRGTIQTIRWNSTENPKSYVKIEILKSGVPKIIIASTLNDGSHPWLIPANQIPGNDYKIKITSTANASYNDTSDENFTIPTPSFTVISPNGWENWTRGTTQTIRWNSTENPKSYVKIELMKSGVAKVIIASTLNDGSHPWIIPANQIPGSDYKIRVSSTFNLSNNDTSDNNFSILPPEIKVSSPDGGENWTRGTAHAITWNYTGNPGAYVKIELLKNGVFNGTIFPSTPNDRSQSWTIPSIQTPGADYKIRITSTTNVAYNDTSDSNFNISSIIP